MDFLKTKNLDTDLFGKIFGRYKIEKEIGHGGMGVVYKAYDTRLDNYVALKMLMWEKGTEATKRFLREASAIAQLNHPNIVRFYETGEFPRPYFTMEYIDGWTLAELIKEKKIKPLYLVEIMIKLCDALCLAHKNKILHRDIKPSNIMITKQGQPKIMDFGLAKLTKEDVEQTSEMGQILGTLLYMAPEQILGKASEKSDIYSIGATIYEALTFVPIFQSDSQINLMYKIANDTPIPPRELNPDISLYLEAICLKCLDKKPHKRYNHFKQLLRELKEFKAHRPIIAKKYTVWVFLSNFIQRNKAICASVLIVFLALVISMVFIIRALESVQIQKNEAQEARDEAKEARKQALKEKKIAQEKVQDIKKLNQAIIKSLEYLRTRKHIDIYSHKQFRAPLESIFEQSIDIKIGTHYNWLKSLIFMYSDKAKNRQEAANVLTKDIENNPGALAYKRRGILYVFQKKYKEAQQDFNKAIDLNPRYADTYYSRGFLYMAQKKYREAEKDFDKVINLDSLYVDAYYRRGIAYYRQKKYYQAEESFTKAIGFDPKQARFYFDRGLMFLDQNKYKKAKNDLDRVISLDNQHIQAHYHRSLIFIRNKKYREAEYDLSTIINLNPQSAKAYNNRGLMYYRQKKYQQAESDYNKAINLNPQFAKAYNNRGLLYYFQERYKEAEKNYDKAIALDPKYASVYGNRGVIYSIQKRYREAIIDWQQAISLGMPKQKFLPLINQAKATIEASK